MTEKEKFEETIRKDIDNGLVDVKFDRNSNGAGSSEEVYAEINQMWASAKPVDRSESRL